MLGVMLHAGAAAAAAAGSSTPTSPLATTTTTLTSYAVSRPSPSSTTMEDVLDSLLGLPPPSRSPSPSPATASAANNVASTASTASSASAASSTHQVPRSCADIRPDPAGSASGGWGPACPAGRGDVNADPDDPEEPAGWEAADLADVAPRVTSASGPPRELPGWNGDTGPAPPVAAPPGWRGTAVVGVVAEEGNDVEEAEFGAALLSLPLDPVRPGAPPPPPRRRCSESSAPDNGLEVADGGGACRADAKGRQRGRRPRRVSFDLSAAGGGAGGALDGEPGAVACRRVGCGRVAPEAAARLRFKSCHNCAHTYCSRECRREHWDSHKRACAVQRVGGLLRRVVARVRADTAAVSATARRGYAAHGRGVVRLLFHSADAAEAYCAGEALALAAAATGATLALAGTELVYVRWADLPAGELGGSLHEDLARLCNTYNPGTRAVTLVVLEVLSEAPSDDGVVMWERQLVSRVFKVHLFREEHIEKTLVLEGVLVNASDTGARSAVLRNIMRALGQRGVDLRDEDHGDAFLRVKEYVEQGQEDQDQAGPDQCPLTVDLHLHSGARIAVILVPDTASVLLDLDLGPSTHENTEMVDVSSRAS